MVCHFLHCATRELLEQSVSPTRGSEAAHDALASSGLEVQMRSRSTFRRRLALALAAALAACGGDSAGDLTDAASPTGSDALRADGGPNLDGASAALPPGCRTLVRDEDCDRTKPPIVFVHGTLGSGDNFSNPALLFASNGYCPERIRALDYDSLATNSPYEPVGSALDRLIDAVRAETGAEKVDLVGHALGARHASTFVRTTPQKVAHYVHISGDMLPGDPGGVPTLCLSSAADAPVECATAQKVVLPGADADRLSLAASRESFTAIYTFLTGAPPRTDQVECGEALVLEGRAQTYGDNRVPVGGRIEIYELGDAPQARGAPVASFEVPADGHIGPFRARRDVAYEFKLLGAAGESRPPRHMYVGSLVRSDRLLRFLYATGDAQTASIGRLINFDDGHAVLTLRRRAGPFIAGRDRLLINGISALSSANADRALSTVGLYVFDAPAVPSGTGRGPGDRISSAAPIFTTSFVSSADIYLPATPPAFIEVRFNDRVLKVPNWPSASQGMSLVNVD